MTADLRQADRAMLDGADQLTAAIADVQLELPAIPKTQTAKVATKTGGSYSYTYANLAKITPLVLPLLGRNGLAWITRPTMSPAGFVLEYELRHVGGASLAGTYPLPDPIRATPQEVGSAITYARRYCLCSVIGVAPDDDDDDAAAAAKTTPKAATAAATRPTRATQAPRGDNAPADEPEGATKPAKAPRTPEQIAGQRVMSMTPPELRSDVTGLDKDEKARRQRDRHDLYALAGHAWALTASGLGGESLAAYGRMARQVAKGDATIERINEPNMAPGLRLIDRQGDPITEVWSDLPSDQPTDPDNARSPGSKGPT
jgi:hypothetical protein